MVITETYAGSILFIIYTYAYLPSPLHGSLASDVCYRRYSYSLCGKTSNAPRYLFQMGMHLSLIVISVPCTVLGPVTIHVELQGYVSAVATVSDDC